jgi:TonB family protein
MDRQTALGCVVVLSCAQFAPILYAAGVQRVHEGARQSGNFSGNVSTCLPARNVFAPGHVIVESLVTEYEDSADRIGRPQSKLEIAAQRDSATGLRPHNSLSNSALTEWSRIKRIAFAPMRFGKSFLTAPFQRNAAKASPATILTTATPESAAQSKPDPAGKLVFEGKVVRIGKPPRMLCGVVAPYRLAKYSVEQVNQGRYDKTEIIVDHLFCSQDVLSDLKPGEKVIVEVDVRKRIPERSNDGEIRLDTDEVDSFYLAKKVTPVSSVATSERRRNYHHGASDPLFLIDTAGVGALPRDTTLKDECEFSSYKPSIVSHFVQTALKTRVTPKYPIEAVQRGIQGRIGVKILVDRDGNVSKACALNGDEVLRRAAEEAALQWKFKRNVVPGWQSYVQAGISFNFVLDGSRAKDADAIRP